MKEKPHVLKSNVNSFFVLRLTNPNKTLYIFKIGLALFARSGPTVSGEVNSHTVTAD